MAGKISTGKILSTDFHWFSSKLPPH